MTEYLVPCEDPANNADDWFIERDGKQYPDDVLVSELEVAEAVVERGLLWSDQGQVDALTLELEEAAKTTALTRRRHAKDACHTTCYFRTQCLGLALEQGHAYGTWGGYYPEELRVIRDLRDARAERRASHQTDTDS